MTFHPEKSYSDTHPSNVDALGIFALGRTPDIKGTEAERDGVLDLLKNFNNPETQKEVTQETFSPEIQENSDEQEIGLLDDLDNRLDLGIDDSEEFGYGNLETLYKEYAPYPETFLVQLELSLPAGKHIDDDTKEYCGNLLHLSKAYPKIDMKKLVLRTLCSELDIDLPKEQEADTLDTGVQRVEGASSQYLDTIDSARGENILVNYKAIYESLLNAFGKNIDANLSHGIIQNVLRRELEARKEDIQYHVDDIHKFEKSLNRFSHAMKSGILDQEPEQNEIN